MKPGFKSFLIGTLISWTIIASLCLVGAIVTDDWCGPKEDEPKTAIDFVHMVNAKYPSWIARVDGDEIVVGNFQKTTEDDFRVPPQDKPTVTIASPQEKLVIKNADNKLIDWKSEKIFIIGNNNKELELDLSGDKMKITGDLDYDEAAKLLLNHIGMNYCKPTKP